MFELERDEMLDGVVNREGVKGRVIRRVMIEDRLELGWVDRRIGMVVWKRVEGS